MKKIIFTLFSVCFFIGIKSQDFEVAPVLMNFSVEPGGSGSHNLHITNHGDKRQQFLLKLADYKIDSLGKRRRVEAGSTDKTLADWISFSPSLVELNPNQSTDILVTLAVPDGHASTRWGVLYVQATQEQTSFDADKVVAAGIRIQPRIAVYIYQSPRSNTNYKAIIESFNEVTKENSSSRTFKATVKNVGEKEIKAKVSLLLSNMSTGEETKLKTKTESLYPMIKKDFDFQLPSDIKKGKYALAAILDYGHNTALEGAQVIINIE